MATLVRDTFNRTSTTSPGSASTGQAWRAEQGTWGTDGTALYSVTAADNDQVTIDTGSQTQDITYTLAAGAGANKYPFTTARWSGIENFYVFRIEPDGSGSVEAWPAYARRGSLIPAGTFVNGNVIRFLVKEETTPTAGTRLTVWRNGTQVMNHLDSTAGRPAGTRMGFRHGSDSGVQTIKWADLTITDGAAGPVAETADCIVRAGGVLVPAVTRYRIGGVLVPTPPA